MLGCDADGDVLHVILDHAARRRVVDRVDNGDTRDRIGAAAVVVWRDGLFVRARLVDLDRLAVEGGIGEECGGRGSP